MKLVCVNIDPINDSDGIPATCHDLIEGNIYTAEYVAKSKWGNPCYFISEVGALRRIERFKPVDCSWIEKIIEQINEQIELDVLVSKPIQ